MLEKRWNECITLEEDYVDECCRILPKSCCFIGHSTNLLSDVLELLHNISCSVTVKLI